jgi:hypothetical protein
MPYRTERKISPERLDGLFLGMTVPQQSSFYGAPWAAGLIGNPHITGPTISQACATSGKVIAGAAAFDDSDICGYYTSVQDRLKHELSAERRV